jgi:serine/threonine-protein kinase HipA
LAVHLYGSPVGILTGADWRTFDFKTTPETFERFDLMSTILSEAIPLRLLPDRKTTARRRNFFAELLPEGQARELLAARARVEQSDVIGLLRRYGRDVAGALEIFDPDDANEPARPELRRLDGVGVRRLMEREVDAPLGNDPKLGRISLGGMQEKVTLTRADGAWHQPLGGYPSTHIIKPRSDAYPTMVFDEEYGSRLARQVGLLDYKVWIEDFAGLPALVVERYDRRPAGGPPQRIHQEDFNQALGASGNQKYQEHGGVVTLKRIAALLARATADGQAQLLRLVTFAVAIGNLDLHAKNLSLLHPDDSPARLAPAYDQVPLLHHPTDGRLALKVNGVYAARQVTAADLVAEGETWGVNDAEAEVESVLDRVAEALATQSPLPGAYPNLNLELEAHLDRLSHRQPRR